jgi:hypothetical protein
MTGCEFVWKSVRCRSRPRCDRQTDSIEFRGVRYILERLLRLEQGRVGLQPGSKRQRLADNWALKADATGRDVHAGPRGRRLRPVALRQTRSPSSLADNLGCRSSAADRRRDLAGRKVRLTLAIVQETPAAVGGEEALLLHPLRLVAFGSTCAGVGASSDLPRSDESEEVESKEPAHVAVICMSVDVLISRRYKAALQRPERAPF